MAAADLWTEYGVGSVSIETVPGADPEDKGKTIAALIAAGFETVLEFPLASQEGQALNPAIITLRQQGKVLAPWVGVMTRSPYTIVLAFSKPGDFIYLKLHMA